ncbi:MAG: UDP-N-acetylmuramate--L-alanine ligase [Anaerolineae bacterium]|nr:UDP-N-acetylmuramate--L-alanine ligase [Anaerolineae bacterium]
MEFIKGQKIHLIGIGGFGISAIARILLERGFTISGSDKQANALTEALARDGATIHIGHAPEHVHGADIIIRTSAVKDDHIEVAEAYRLNIPVYKRQDILEPLMRDDFVIAIAGTHGKTTTTAMTVHVLQKCQSSPSYIVGGIMANTGKNAGVSKIDKFVIEADEYDNAFWGIPANVVILTNIEYDHPDFFENDSVMLDSFRKFLDRMRPYSTLVICADSPYAVKLANEYRSKVGYIHTYGINRPADMMATNIRIDGDKTHFDVAITGSLEPFRYIPEHITLPMTGLHNVQNALGALLVASTIGDVNLDGIPKAFASFKSTGRRFEIRGERDGIIVVDDYAHHPTAIRMTLEGAKMRYPNHKVWAVWQPHMYSRTMVLMEDYAHAFYAADKVIVTDIYAARENPIPRINGAWATEKIKHDHKQYGGDLEATAKFLRMNVEAPAVVLIMSAGDAPKIGELLLKG